MATLYQFPQGRSRARTPAPPVEFLPENQAGLPLLTVRITTRQVLRLTGKISDFRRLAEELLAVVAAAEGKSAPALPFNPDPTTTLVSATQGSALHVERPSGPEETPDAHHG